MIPTAKKFLDDSEIFETIKLKQNVVKQPTFLYDDVQRVMIEFSRIHVEAFREEIKEKCFDFEGLESIVKDIYPLENIK